MNSFRRHIAALVLATAILFALATTGAASAAAPKVTSATVTEGQAFSVPGHPHLQGEEVPLRDRHRQRLRHGRHRLHAGVHERQQARKYAKLRKTLTVATVDNAVCEATETLLVRVNLIKKGVVTTFTGTLTILDNDCAPGMTPPAPLPARRPRRPPPAPRPPPPGSPPSPSPSPRPRPAPRSRPSAPPTARSRPASPPRTPAPPPAPSSSPSRAPSPSGAPRPSRPAPAPRPTSSPARATPTSSRAP